MNKATHTLINNNLWRDISEAPRGTGEQFIVCDESGLIVMAEAVAGYPYDDPFEIFDVTSCRFGTATNFRPLPDDRCATALAIAVKALVIADNALNYTVTVPEVAKQRERALRNAAKKVRASLKQITEIAGKGGER